MITNNFNKELRGISDALRDLGYTGSTIGLCQRYWKEYCVYHGSLDIDESSMDKFLLVNYGIQREHQYFKTTVRGKGCAPQFAGIPSLRSSTLGRKIWMSVHRYMIF